MLTIVSRSSIAFAALALVAAGTSASARGADEGNVIATAPDASGAPAAKLREKRYCFMAESTGSRIPVKICKTKKEWESEGVDVPSDR